MNEFNEPRRRARPQAARSRAMRTSMGIFLIAVGAILTFAITTGSPQGLNVHIVGIILILAGVLGMVMPGSARARLRPGLLRTRWVSPGPAVAREEPPPGAELGGYYDDGQPLADELPGKEGHLPGADVIAANFRLRWLLRPATGTYPAFWEPVQPRRQRRQYLLD
jgi:hypothetical protein